MTPEERKEYNRKYWQNYDRKKPKKKKQKKTSTPRLHANFSESSKGNSLNRAIGENFNDTGGITHANTNSTVSNAQYSRKLDAQFSNAELRERMRRWLDLTEEEFYIDYGMLSVVDRVKVRLSMMEFVLPRLARVEQSDKPLDDTPQIELVTYENKTDNSNLIAEKDMEILELKEQLKELLKKIDEKE